MYVQSWVCVSECWYMYVTEKEATNIRGEDMAGFLSRVAGIGKAEGVIFFVKDAVLGDRILAKVMKMKKNYGYARLIEILKPSPYRIEPRCPYARQCGGCQLQALDYGQQLIFKENKVRNHLKRIGGFQLEDGV